jgi:hypothetical protein
MAARCITTMWGPGVECPLIGLVPALRAGFLVRLTQLPKDGTGLLWAVTVPVHNPGLIPMTFHCGVVDWEAVATPPW